MRAVHVLPLDSAKTVCGLGPNDPARYPLVGIEHVSEDRVWPDVPRCPVCWAGARPTPPKVGQASLFD